MIVIRIEGDEIRLEPGEWELWVEDGRVPPHALLLDTDGRWVPAAGHPEYLRLRAGRTAPPEPPAPDVRGVLFPRRGISATETLLVVNLLVAAILLVRFGNAYLGTIIQWVSGKWVLVDRDNAVWWWIPTLFLHADAGHLFRNMVSLVAGAGAVEFLIGSRWTFLVYLVTGMGGAWFSFVGHGGPPLSIGASGAIFGLAGCAVAFVVRRRALFSYRQRWKAWRVYVPLFVAMFMPSLLHADYYAHTGGLVTGLLLGLVLAPHPRVVELAEAARALDRSRGD